jgi:hypothetical protein
MSRKHRERRAAPCQKPLENAAFARQDRDEARTVHAVDDGPPAVTAERGSASTSDLDHALAGLVVKGVVGRTAPPPPRLIKSKPSRRYQPSHLSNVPAQRIERQNPPT